MSDPENPLDMWGKEVAEMVVRLAKQEATLVVIRMLDDLAHRASCNAMTALTASDILAIKRDIALQLEKEMTP